MTDLDFGSGPGEWTGQALCAHSSLNFFPDRNQQAAIASAKAVCAQCPVQGACLDFGMGEDYGIWGGMMPDERAALKPDMEVAVARCMEAARFDWVKGDPR